MRRSSLLLLVVAMGAVVAHAESGSLEEEISFSRPQVRVTDHLLFSSARENATSSRALQTLMHEALVHGEYDSYQASVQFANKFGLNNTAISNQPFVLEKKQLAATWAHWDLKLGDSHQEYGRGIALALFRDDNFGLNNTLEGASTRYHTSDLEVGLLAGRVNGLRAPASIRAFENPVKDRNVWLVGTHVKGKPASGSQIGAHHLLSYNQPFPGNYWDKNSNTFGVSLAQSDIFGEVDLYAETNLLLGLQYVTDRLVRLPNGYGSYLSLTWAPLPWKAKWEIKDYRGFWFEFHRPPTLEEDIVETVNLSDVSGSRWQVERKLGSYSSVSGSYLIGEDRSYNYVLHHGVLGSKVRVVLNTDLEMKGGYRGDSSGGSLVHASFKSKTPTGRGQALEWGFRKQLARPVYEDRNVFDFTYTFSDQFNSGLGYEYVPSNSETAGQHFVNLQATYKVGALTAKAFVGQTSGGTVCSGGICRRVPPYTGAMVETFLLF